MHDYFIREELHAPRRQLESQQLPNSKLLGRFLLCRFFLNEEPQATSPSAPEATPHSQFRILDRVLPYHFRRNRHFRCDLAGCPQIHEQSGYRETVFSCFNGRPNFVMIDARAHGTVMKLLGGIEVL